MEGGGGIHQLDAYTLFWTVLVEHIQRIVKTDTFWSLKYFSLQPELIFLVNYTTKKPKPEHEDLAKELFSETLIRGWWYVKLAWTSGTKWLTQILSEMFVILLSWIERWKQIGKIIKLNLPSSQTSVSILTANALLCRCCKFCPPGGCLKQLTCCFSVIGWTPKNGVRRTWEPNKPGVESTPSSKSIISDEDSDRDDFFKCWPVFFWKRKSHGYTRWT